MLAADRIDDPVVVERTVGAPPRDVYEAWTMPARMKTWLHMGPRWSAPSAATDPREGGRYSIQMRTPSGERLSYEGDYRQVEPEQLLEFSWPAYANTELQTLVKVTLEDAGTGRTTVSVEHHGLPDEDARNDHRVGWAAVLQRLDEAVGGDADGA